MASHQPDTENPAPAEDDPKPARGRWSALTGAIGGVVGLLPHLLHHVGLLAGTALVAGAGGTALFGVLGLLATVPMLLRLRRRFRSWWAPAFALAAFAIMFALSTLLLGPAVRGAVSEPADGGTHRPNPAVSDHGTHHS